MSENLDYDDFEVDISESAQLRQAVISEFIVGWMASRGLKALSEADLITRVLAWEPVLVRVPAESLESRGGDSLFAACCAAPTPAYGGNGCDVRQVLNTWETREAIPSWLAQSQQAERAAEQERRAAAGANEHGRQAIRDFLARRGIGEKQLAEMERALL